MTEERSVDSIRTGAARCRRTIVPTPQRVPRSSTVAVGSWRRLVIFGVLLSLWQQRGDSPGSQIERRRRQSIDGGVLDGLHDLAPTLAGILVAVIVVAGVLLFKAAATSPNRSDASYAHWLRCCSLVTRSTMAAGEDRCNPVRARHRDLPSAVGRQAPAGATPLGIQGTSGDADLAGADLMSLVHASCRAVRLARRPVSRRRRKLRHLQDASGA